MCAACMDLGAMCAYHRRQVTESQRRKTEEARRSRRASRDVAIAQRQVWAFGYINDLNGIAALRDLGGIPVSGDHRPGLLAQVRDAFENEQRAEALPEYNPDDHGPRCPLSYMRLGRCTCGFGE